MGFSFHDTHMAPVMTANGSKKMFACQCLTSLISPCVDVSHSHLVLLYNILCDMVLILIQNHDSFFVSDMSCRKREQHSI